MVVKYWEHFDHGADIGVRGSGVTKEEAFEQVAVALTAVLVDPSKIREEKFVAMDCEAPDLELLLNEWLNTVIFEMATKKIVFVRYQVVFKDLSLKGRAWGQVIDQKYHQLAVEVKGATLTELKVDKSVSGNWIAQCVVDV